MHSALAGSNLSLVHPKHKIMCALPATATPSLNSNSTVHLLLLPHTSCYCRSLNAIPLLLPG